MGFSTTQSLAPVAARVADWEEAMAQVFALVERRARFRVAFVRALGETIGARLGLGIAWGGRVEGWKGGM